MANRHIMAVQAVNCNDLFQLADALKEACKEVFEEKGNPYQDPAVNILCHQIAFAGNGDHQFLKFYREAFDYCLTQVERQNHGLPEKTDEKPVCQSS